MPTNRWKHSNLVAHLDIEFRAEKRIFIAVRRRTEMPYQDPRGPIRRIVAVDSVNTEHPDHTAVTLDCGHIRKFNPIYHYKVGSDARCLACLKREQ